MKRLLRLPDFLRKLRPPDFSDKDKRNACALRVVLLILLVVVLVKNAWLCDDAYISFRVVDNFVDGEGLRWNVDERVQVYTNPLWVLLVSCFYFFTREIYFTSLLLSMACTTAAVAIVGFGLARSSYAALLAVLGLSLSKAFVDYGTSGLENPLTFLLLSLYWYLFVFHRAGARSAFVLSFVAALSAVNRLDNAVIILPSLLYLLYEKRSWRTVGLVALGSLPLVAWEVFSIVYYGFPFPNAAYAKLNTGIPSSELYGQGLRYLLDTVNIDPLTSLIIPVAIVLPLLVGAGEKAILSAGMVLHLLYVVKVGGDFMSGRFLTSALLTGVIVIVLLLPRRPDWPCLVGMAVALLIGVLAPRSPWSSSASYVPNKARDIRGLGLSAVADARSYYYRHTGLLRAGRAAQMPHISWRALGKQAREREPVVVEKKSVGVFGYFAGPDVHVLDKMALCDPLLARLPSKRQMQWRIGHFERVLPEGYQEALETGVDERLEDEELRSYYGKLSVITQGDLFTRERWQAIWDMNLGRYDHLIDEEYYRCPDMPEYRLDELAKVREEGAARNRKMKSILDCGCEVRLARPSHAEWLEVSLGAKVEYQLVFFRDEEELGREWTPHKTKLSEATLDVHIVRTPHGARKVGFNRIGIYPVSKEKRYFMGHLVLLE